MAAIVYKCPGCGSYMTDDTNQDVITCPNCGASVTKQLTEQDKLLRYQERKEIREAEERREEKEYRRKESKKAGWMLWLLFIGLGVLAYLFEKGIL